MYMYAYKYINVYTCIYVYIFICIYLYTACEESSTIMQSSPSEIWKWLAILLYIHTGNFDMKIAGCLSVNLSTIQSIQKRLDESNDDYKVTAV